MPHPPAEDGAPSWSLLRSPRVVRGWTWRAPRRWLQRHLGTLAALVALGLFGWFVLGLIFGGGRMHVFSGTPFGEDLLSLHAAGTIVRRAPAQLYDDQLARQVQALTFWGRAADDPSLPREVFNRYMSPPHTAALLAPLSRIDFAIVAYGWALASLAALLAVPWLLRMARPWRAGLLALGFVPVWLGVTAGQNTLFTLFACAAAYRLWQDGHGLRAGLVLGVVAIWKPHLVAGPALLFLLEARRNPRPLLGLALIALGLAAIDFGLYPAQSWHYLRFGGGVIAGQTPLWANLRPGGEMTVAGFFAGLLPAAPQAGRALALTLALEGVLVYLRAHRHLHAVARQARRARNDGTLYAAALLLGLWLAPHAHLYEWSLLLLPAMLLWRSEPRARTTLVGLFAAFVLLAPLSVRLARAGLDAWGWTLHPALPLLLLAATVVRACVYREPVAAAPAGRLSALRLAVLPAPTPVGGLRARPTRPPPG